jgi:hypothetical protein
MFWTMRTAEFSLTAGEIMGTKWKVVRSRVTGRWVVLMSKEDYRKRAAECLRLANESSNAGHRASL